MRYCVRASSLPFGLAQLKHDFAPLAKRYEMQWQIHDSAINQKVVLMASKASHCLFDLLQRWYSKELPCDIVAVVSNHQNLQPVVAAFGVPYLHIPMLAANKSEHFTQLGKTLAEMQPDTIVLARYMQILPQHVCQQYQGRIINIHHSFLPSFQGAKPYHQAAQRGVKLVGATCHYVNEMLDDGPIIDQDVVRVHHYHSVEDMVRLGKNVEQLVLARGVRSHLENRILLHGNKTVVF